MAYDINTIYNRYKAGESVRSIADSLGVKFYQIYQQLEKRDDFPLPSGRYKKLSQKDRDLVCVLYQQGASLAMIARGFKVAIQTINKILIKNRIEKRKMHKKYKKI
jgi:DNA invertase Pin-like site-specific DNA recombinase